MFKKSPKNCFKPVLPSSTNASMSGFANNIEHDNASTASIPEHQHKSNINNGPLLSYFNYFSLPQVDLHSYRDV